MAAAAEAEPKPLLVLRNQYPARPQRLEHQRLEHQRLERQRLGLRVVEQVVVVVQEQTRWERNTKALFG